MTFRFDHSAASGCRAIRKGDSLTQLTFQFALDAIVKERRWFGDNFLYGCHAIGEGDLFPASELARRVDLSPGLPVVATAAEGTSDGT